MIKTTKTTYCPKKLITNNYLLTIRRTSKNIFIYRPYNQQINKSALGCNFSVYIRYLRYSRQTENSPTSLRPLTKNANMHFYRVSLHLNKKNPQIHVLTGRCWILDWNSGLGCEQFIFSLMWYLTIIPRNRAEYHLILSRRGRRPDFLRAFNRGKFLPGS